MDYLIIRMISSFIVGVLLSQAGSLMQLGTRNILASPSTLGFDGLAVLWFLVIHSLAIFFGWSFSLDWPLLWGIPVFILLGFIFPRFLTGTTRFEKIILLGLTFNLLVGAVFSLWQFLFLAFNLPFPVELWFGHFRFASPFALKVLLLAEVAVLLGLKVYFKDFMMFSIGPVMTLNWGLNEKKLFKVIFIIVALTTFLVVNLFGAFSFLGLVFPLLARKLWFKKYDLKGEIFLGALVNGLALMTIDFLCYYFPIFGAEVPVGLIVTGVGALSLILLLWSDHKHSEIVANPHK